MPIFFKLMNFEKVMGWEQRYRIDWDAPAGAGASVAARCPDQARVTIRQASCPPKPNPLTCSTSMSALAGA